MIFICLSKRSTLKKKYGHMIISSQSTYNLHVYLPFFPEKLSTLFSDFDPCHHLIVLRSPLHR